MEGRDRNGGGSSSGKGALMEPFWSRDNESTWKHSLVGGWGGCDDNRGGTRPVHPFLVSWACSGQPPVSGHRLPTAGSALGYLGSHLLTFWPSQCGHGPGQSGSRPQWTSQGRTPRRESLQEARPGGPKTLKVHTEPLGQEPIHTPRIWDHVILLSVASRLPHAGQPIFSASPSTCPIDVIILPDCPSGRAHTQLSEALAPARPSARNAPAFPSCLADQEPAQMLFLL